MSDVYVILHNIRSVQNVGAIFRTAECAGVEKIFLSGYTPSPIDRFGRARADFNKSALGAERFVEWEQYKNISSLINKLKKEGFEVVSVEQSKKSVDYKKIKIKGSTAFIFGNEVRGLSDSILNKSDKVTEIPVRGEKESLNVSTAVGIFLFRVLNI